MRVSLVLRQELLVYCIKAQLGQQKSRNIIVYWLYYFLRLRQEEMKEEFDELEIGLNCKKMLVKSRKYTRQTSYSCDLDSKKNLKNWIQINKRQPFLKSGRNHSKSKSFNQYSGRSQVLPRKTTIKFSSTSNHMKLHLQKIDKSESSHEKHSNKTSRSLWTNSPKKPQNSHLRFTISSRQTLWDKILINCSPSLLKQNNQSSKDSKDQPRPLSQTNKIKFLKFSHTNGWILNNQDEQKSLLLFVKGNSIF